MVIENNVSTIDRKAKMDHKFKSEGQDLKFSLFLTCTVEKWEMFGFDCFVCLFWFFMFQSTIFQLCWDGYLARINVSYSMTQLSDTGEARIRIP